MTISKRVNWRANKPTPAERERPRRLVAGDEIKGMFILEVHPASSNCRRVYTVRCKCGWVMTIPARSLLENQFACPKCLNKMNASKPHPYPDAPYKVEAINYIVPVPRGNGNMRRIDLYPVWYVKCNCGTRVTARHDFIEEGKFPGCKDCIDSALFRARHGLR